MKVRFIKIAILAIFLLFGAAFFGFDYVQSNKLTANEYHARISETYDFRFGEDRPFAPWNATTFNGKFIKGEDVISRQRFVSHGYAPARAGIGARQRFPRTVLPEKRQRHHRSEKHCFHAPL
jgi:hypothetical protein